MQRFISLFLIALAFFSCKNDHNKNQESTQTMQAENRYPESLEKIFEAHGGVDQWNSMNGLVFRMERPNGTESTLTNLKSRHSIIEAPTYKLGYNGKDLWIKETDTIKYNGNAKFYNGLMFYFYAMPFILADEGIIYEETKALKAGDTEYPGILISYNSGVGVSPEDQYVIYYHPETFEMSWLAYTVTFGKDEKNSNFRYIEYHDWQTLEGLKLPKAISWYKVEEGLPTEKRNTLEFVDVNITKTSPNETLFEPELESEIMQ